MEKCYTFKSQSPENGLPVCFRPQATRFYKRCRASMTQHRPQGTKVKVKETGWMQSQTCSSRLHRGWSCVPSQIPILEVPTLSILDVTVSAVSLKVTELKWSYEWALIQRDWCSYKKWTGHGHTYRKDRVRIRGEADHVQARERGLRRKQLGRHLASDFEPPGWRDDRLVCLSLPVSGTAALANYRRGLVEGTKGPCFSSRNSRKVAPHLPSGLPRGCREMLVGIPVVCNLG